MPTTRALGPVTVIPLPDGEGTFPDPRTAMFPEATPELWAAADALDPGAVTPGGEWYLRYRCFALRLESGRIILVDAGIGPADSPAATWAPVPGRLPAELMAAGIDPADVDTVVLTHLHTDHIGWAVIGEPGVPYFRNARYLMQAVEVGAIRAGSEHLTRRLLAPLGAQLSTVDGRERLAPGISVVATPGHTPGHQCVLLEHGEDAILFTGDLLVHAIQVIDPELAYGGETDPAAARDSRLGMLRDLAGRGGETLLATPHLTEPFTTPTER
ncbi:MBL fold metallo-hydrolase [Rhizomonospora bruguierae]|uniref:MBL fold metallo-hydrolase n=1 Tax=Rhizomonospora bruguierae TaxID=1581705 RepID=UPI001BCD13AE|nr:MBL fold metallo-hydrolase [Micromonospora sp. NBRC 107566]